METPADRPDSSLRLLANVMVVSLPKFGRWAEAIRDYQTPWGKVGYRQLEVLWALRHGLPGVEEPTPSDLTALLDVQASVVTRVLAHLEANGFMTRLTDPADGRRSHLRITETGVKVSEYVEELYNQEMLAALAGLGPEELAELDRSVRLLDRIADQLLAARLHRRR